MTRIFVSYSRHDEEFTVNLVNLLRRAGDNIWYDHELTGGSLWWRNIEYQITRCDIFLFVTSPNSLNSEVCHQEYQRARRLLKHIVPVIVSDRIPEHIDEHGKRWQSLKAINWVNIVADDQQHAGADISAKDITEIYTAIRQNVGSVRRRKWLGVWVALALVLLLLGVRVNNTLPLRSGSIAFTSYEGGQSEIYVYDGGLWGYIKSQFAGLNPRNITQDGFLNTLPAWSGDGRLVFNVNGEGDQPTIYRTGPNGDIIPRSLQNGIAPVWSAAGDRIAFASSTGSDYDIFVMNAEGGEPTNLTESRSGFDDQYPAWSPDGRYIAFQSRSLGSGDLLGPIERGKWQIHVVDTTTSIIFDVTGDDDANNVRPTWSPDGRQIAFASDRLASQYDIYVMDLDVSDSGTLVPSTLAPTNITNNGIANDNDPTWSPDGSEIAFVSNSSGREQIYVLDVSQCLYVGLSGCNSDNARRLTFFNERNIDPAWPLQGL